MFEDVDVAPSKPAPQSKKYRDKIRENPKKYQQYLEKEKERYRKKEKRQGDWKPLHSYQNGNKHVRKDSGKLTKETKGPVIRTERRHEDI